MSQSYQIIRTPQQARQWLSHQGKSIRQFCQERGFSVQSGYDVLTGRVAGNFGDAHRVAVALGLKPDPDNPAPTLTQDQIEAALKLGQPQPSSEVA